MKRALQIVLPLLILVLSGSFIYWLIATKPVPERRQFREPTPEVVVRPMKRESYEITLHSQGTVQARTTSTLIPEVRGRIISVAQNFQEGAFFEEGDVLLEIDPSDYQTELIAANANLAQVQLRTMEERARYEQAQVDWDRLNPELEANPLTLREPQLKQAEAGEAAALARAENAKLNLERTRIQAPFAGRILTKSVDLGQYVSPGNAMARVYSVDYAEVRLPLTATQFAYLELPSVYRGEDPTIREGPIVQLSAEVAGEKHEWTGQVVRAEGAVDTKSRQVFVVAQVSNPYGRKSSGTPPLKVGTFVQAQIKGATLEDVFIVPRKLLRENRYVLMVDSEHYLDRREVHVVWDTDESIVINKGISEGDLLCLTNVPFALEGWPVVISNQSEVPEQKPVEVAENTTQERRPPRPPAGGGGGGPGGFIANILAAIPEDKPLPDDLKTRIDAAVASGDRSAIRPVMGELREWAQANDVDLPAPAGLGGGGPRS